MRSSANATTPDLCFTDAPVEREVPHCHGDTLLEGIIDRLVITQSADEVVTAAIIDFETDAIDSSDDVRLAQRVEHYTPQLRAYRRAVAGMYGLPEPGIATRLVSVECAAVVDVV
jgi:ATP-dependent helicase/nuclease subunit A